MSKFDLQSDAEIPGDRPDHILDSKPDDRPKCISCGQLLVPFPGIGMGCGNRACSCWDIRLDANGRKGYP